MILILIGALVGMIGALPILVFGGGTRRLFLWAAVSVPIWSAFLWLDPIQLVGPFLGSPIQGRLLFAFGATAVYYLARYRCREDERVINRTFGLAFVTLILLLVGWFVTTSGMFHSSDYRAFVADRVNSGTWTEDVSPIDPAHLRQVSQAEAEWKGSQALSQVPGGALGSQFRPGGYVIQKTGNGLAWVSPLEYQGLMAWFRADCAPGYVRLSAEDRDQKPRLVSDLKLRYLESAYFNDNLWRHVVTNGYLTKGLTDPTFEVDDEGRPFYVYTRFEYTIGYGGMNPVGAIIVDPQTGDMKEYGMDDLPAWVDRIVPEETAHDRLEWYGSYVHGWWNSMLGSQDVVVPTDDDMTLVWGTGGEAYWFTGMTSVADTDHAITSVMLMSSRTGQVREYRVDGGSEETNVMAAVESSVSEHEDWVATPPIPENVYGDLAWVVPVVNEDGVPQRIAIVSRDAAKVALGENVRQALAEYRRKVADAGGHTVAEDAATLESLIGVVDRFAASTRNGNTTFLFTVLENDRVFEDSSGVSPELPLTRAGDQVSIGYLETGETMVPVRSFDNLDIASRVSEAQQRADTIADEQRRSE